MRLTLPLDVAHFLPDRQLLRDNKPLQTRQKEPLCHLFHTQTIREENIPFTQRLPGSTCPSPDRSYLSVIAECLIEALEESMREAESAVSRGLEYLVP